MNRIWGWYFDAVPWRRFVHRPIQLLVPVDPLDQVLANPCHPLWNHFKTLFVNLFISRFNTYFVISLSRTIRLTSLITEAETVTARGNHRKHHFWLLDTCQLTFFSNHGVFFIIWVVCVTQLSIWSEFELHKFMTKLAAMANTKHYVTIRKLINTIQQIHMVYRWIVSN